MKKTLFTLWFILLGFIGLALGTPTSTTTKIGRDDVKWYDGLSPTFTRRTSTGGSLTLTKLGDGVSLRGLLGTSGGANTSSIQSVLNNIGSNKTILEFGPETWTIDQDLTIPSNVAVKAVYGTTISVSSGKTLTINSFIDAPPVQIFSGTGSVVIGAGVSPVLADWWGSDLYKAYAAVTSDSIITYFSAQTITAAIDMTKANVSIDGGNAGQTYAVTVPSGFSGTYAISYMNTTLEWDTMGYVFIRNMHLDVDDKANYGVMIYGGYFGGLENVSIMDAVLDSIRVELSGDAVWSKVSLDNVVAYSPGRHCLSVVNDQNPNVYEGLTSDRFTCWLAGDSGIYLETDASHQLGFHFKDLWLEGVTRHGIESHGPVWWDVDTGWVEWTDPTTTVDANETLTNIYMIGDSGYGGFAKINKWRVVGASGGNLPYINATCSLTVCESDFGNANHNRMADCYTLGQSRTDTGTWGPYYTAGTKTSTNAISQPDLYGVRWMSNKGSYDWSDNDTQWRAIDLPIKIPITYESFSEAGVTLWYPLDDFILTNITFKMITNWTCDNATTTEISFGVSEKNDMWIDGMAKSAIDATYWRPVNSTLNSEAGSEVYGGKPWFMRRIQSEDAPFPNCGSTSHYNCVVGYSVNGTCSAGTGILLIDGYYINPLTQYSTP